MRTLGAVAAAVTAAVVMGSSLQTPASAKVEPGNPLVVSTRDKLELCVVSAPGLAGRQAQVLDRVSASVQNMRATNAHWKSAYGQSDPPGVKGRCDVRIPTSPFDGADATALGRGMVTRPSAFRVVVVVLGDADAKAVLGNRSMSHFAYEMMQVDDHNAVEVTNGIVVREDALESPEFIEQYLPLAVSLPPSQDEPVPGPGPATSKGSGA